MAIFPAQLQSFQIAGAGQVIGDTTMTFTQMLDISGNLVQMSSLGSLCYMTIEPNTINEEQIQFTGITQNTNGTATITGVSSVGFLTPFPVTTGFAKTHAGGMTAIVTNTSAFYAGFANVNNPEIVSGLWTFSTSPIVPTPTTATQAANKSYVDGVAIAGAPDSSTTVKGIGRVSVAPVSPTIPIFVGQNDPVVPTQGENDALVGNNTDIAVGTGNKFVTQTGLIKSAENYGVTTGSANAYVLTLSPVVTSYGNMSIRFTTNFANTASATINVNSLGAKTIQLNGSALTTGQLANGATYTATYDGTNFQLTSPTAGAAFSKSFNAISTSPTSASTQTIAHGLGIAPKEVRIYATIVETSVQNYIVNSHGVYNGSTTACVYSSGNISTGSVIVSSSSTSQIIVLQISTTNQQMAACTVDATNITLVWTGSTYDTNARTFMVEAIA